jgi:hypothetical protein
MDELNIINKTICLCAKRCSGKSYLIRYFVEQYRDKYSKIFVICPTEQINHFYKEITDEKYIFDTWDEGWVEDLINSLTKYKSENQGKTRQVLLILDDLISDVRFSESKGLKKLFTRGRHINISVIISQQSVRGIPLVCRTNCDYFICGQLNQSSIEILADEMRAGNLTKKEFIDLYHDSTKDYNFLIINNTSTKNGDLEEIYSQIKCPKKYFDK